jgi:hypothetical protein
MNDITMNYSGIWNIPSNITLDGNGHQIKVQDTSKPSAVYYYYNSTNNYQFAITGEGYIYDGLILNYDGINNTGSGHDSSAAVWQDLSGNNNNITNIVSSDWLDNGLALHTSIGPGPTGAPTEFGNVTYQSQNNVTPIGTNVTMEIALLHNARQYAQIGFANTSNLYPLCLKLRQGTDSNPIAYWNCQPSTMQRYDNQEPLDEIVSFAYVNNYSGGSAAEYMNNVKKPAAVSNMNQAALPFTIVNAAFEPLNGNMYSVRVYNRGLTYDELTYNYQIDQSRFGIQ